jgi:anti-sigma28 factor (negative regulator of flagellin synthesis)
MRIDSNKPTFVEPAVTREKSGTDAPTRAVDTPSIGEAALTSESVGTVAQSADVAAREFEQTIAARLDQVREQLRSGTYAIDYDRLAQRLSEEGFGS